MKQVLQNLGNGETILAKLPRPQRSMSCALVETTSSLVSLGTERMLIDFGRGSWLTKARAQPDKVKQVIQKIKTDGLAPTLDAVRSKLNTPIALGYCNVGTVCVCDADQYQAGDRVASNGPHAEVVSVPATLTAKIPDAVSDRQAAFTVVGAIALQGIRLLQPTLGERIVVSGLGLIGLLAVQMLRANGCQVLGIDFDAGKLKLAQQFGAETVDLSEGTDPVEAAIHWSRGVGVDGVLITASAKGDELIHQVAKMCRQRGRIVLVGVVGLNLQRADFYEKELSFQVSCSYGPGRYDPNYEQRGLDYPIGFVRWTEQRNFEAVLQLMADGKLDVQPLITHRFAFEDALRAYEAIDDPKALGILLDYGAPQGLGSAKFADVVEVRRPSLGSASPDSPSLNPSPCEGEGDDSCQSLPVHGSPLPQSLPTKGEGGRGASRDSFGATIKAVNRKVAVGFLGAGNFASRVLMPALPTDAVSLRTIASGTGVSASHAAKKFKFERVASIAEAIVDDAEIDAVFIATPHHLHASQVCQALAAGKHVFVEKPLALTQEELDDVAQALDADETLCLMVGFNRRFSPHMVAIKSWLNGCTGSMSLIMTVNAGMIPPDHWTQDRDVGGGRVVGEACHFIDLARFLVGSPIRSVKATPMSGPGKQLGDCASLQLSFEDGSIGTIHYLANGSKQFPKERIEVFCGQRVMACDNFRVTREFGGKKRKLRTRSQDKGHQAELQAFVRALQQGGHWPIPRAELMEVSRVAIELAEQVYRG